ncbi:cupin domain-containing protein [Rhizobium puerariae]|uniref:Cupin domain-containing protein n=1 Tax=Rhizobium puerariae TaxID=1585791 RepID=A0ABV6AG86_9HYPH
MSWQIFAATAATLAVRYKSYLPERRQQEPLVASCPHSLPMEPRPIEPSWVISGTPVARAASHSQADDKCATTTVWDCTAGQFRWFFGWDEVVVILEGEVHVTAEDGTVRVLRSGDLAYFKAGTWATWRIDDYVKKIAVVRKPFPLAVSLYYRILNRLLGARRRVGLAA